jgi:hypothetical protein
LTKDYRIRHFYDKMPILVSQTGKGKKRLHAYLFELGAFVDAFAKVETAMHLSLRWYTKTSTPTTRAVFSGVRTNEAGGFLKRLAEVGEIDAANWALLKPIVEHLGKINEVRNRLLHLGASGIAEGEGHVTNASRALTAARVEKTTMNPDILRAMTSDLQKIYHHLLISHVGHQRSGGEYADQETTLSAPWLYIPEQQHQKPRAGKAKKPQT